MQTHSKITPGQWKLPVGVIGADKVWAEDQNGNETLIARGIENEDDARLIAAAPELLAALDYLQAMPNDPRAHRQALDALAKAKGQ